MLASHWWREPQTERVARSAEQRYGGRGKLDWPPGAFSALVRSVTLPFDSY